MAHVELVDINTCKKNLRVEVPPEVANEEFERISREFARHAKVAGFRPGKTPLGIIKKRYQSEIKQEMIQKLVPRYYEEALREKQLEPISEPLLDEVEYQPGGGLSFKAVFEILPPLTIRGYTGLRITPPKGHVTPEEIDERLEALRDEHAVFVPIEDRAAGLGDFLTVHFKGKLIDESGVEFEDKNVVLELGGEHTASGFSDNLEGVKTGENRTFRVDFPRDFHNPRLAGNTVEYQTEVVAVKEKRLPPLDDDLAAEVGSFSSLDELREGVRAQLESDQARKYTAETEEELLQQIISKNSFEVPECLVEAELGRILQRIAERMAAEGVDVERANLDWKAMADQNRVRALERTRRNLALTSIADQESISVSEKELDEEIGRLADMMHKTPEATRASLAKNNRLEELQRQIRRQKALDWVRQQSSAA